MAALTAESLKLQNLIDLPGLTLEEWEGALAPLLKGAWQPAYRLNQILNWVYKRPVEGLQSMSDVPASLRSALAERFVLHGLEAAQELQSADGTRKFLWKRRWGEPIESVYIPEPDRRTFCISTQAGCPVRCTFCATGHGGFNGQLEAGEIVDQVLSMRLKTGVTPTNLVFMGMGEPLLNFPNVLKAIDILCQPRQVGLGARKLTVSTVGVPQRIVELGKRQPQVKLAISLHAARHDLRTELIPLNRQYPLEEVLQAAREHCRTTGKKVTFEYIILPGVNDLERDARDLGKILRGFPSRINLIGFNPFPGSSYEKPETKRLLWFRDRLGKHYPGVVTIRRSRGEDIQGACGQLSLKAAKLAAV
ncbi:MAG: 23S rRNA (adenine(2503)-C(2))-methyltransferase RlmN [Planctomycetes bacterium]|nr:23S rRNA (adenine(2503)-C(2))-methyltransferase RlmN [Planctomycetota bacterium]